MEGDLKMKILCYGDSNTFGYDPRLGTSGRLPKEARWTGILDALPGVSVINEGLNGRTFPTVSGAFRYLERLLSDHADADVVTVMLGTNDLFSMRNVSAEAIGERARIMFDRVPALASDRTILICPPQPDTVWGGFYERILYAAAGLPACLKACAEDAGARFLDAGEWAIPQYANDVHFTEEGHRLFAEYLAEALKIGPIR